MSVIRVNKTGNYTVMSNYHLKEKTMSLKAKGLLSVMLSLPEEWDYSIAGLAAICNESERTIRRILDELEEYGYLVMKKLMPDETKSKKIEYEYNIYEEPQKTSGQKQVADFGRLPYIYISNNKLINNKILNNKYIVEEILDYLNKKTDQHYKSTTPKTQTLIKARINEGFTIDDFKKVIDNKIADWQYTDMERYLRPETLFGTKFESYLNQRQTAEPEWFGKNIAINNAHTEELEELLGEFK